MRSVSCGPVDVVIECLKERRFPDTMTRTRRDHMKFIALDPGDSPAASASSAKIKTSIDEDGETFEYIEATEADAKLAWELSSHVLMRTRLTTCRRRPRRLLLLIDKMVTAECERLQIERLDYRFTRPPCGSFTGWSDSQLKTHLHRLEELEYLALHAGLSARASSTRSTSRWTPTAGRYCRG